MWQLASRVCFARSNPTSSSLVNYSLGLRTLSSLLFSSLLFSSLGTSDLEEGLEEGLVELVRW